MDFNHLAEPQIVQKTVAALIKNGISAEQVQSAASAQQRVREIIPAGARVMTMTSVTLEQTGLLDILNQAPYQSVKNQLAAMNRDEHGERMQEIGAAPTWAVGSVHAVTQQGEVIIASNTGSQLPAYAYGAAQVLWVVSTKKIVTDLDAAMQRIQAHIVPQESQRARQAYNLPDSWHTFVSKLLIINREVAPNRIRLLFVNEDLGF
jgi:hypothetical protein